MIINTSIFILLQLIPLTITITLHTTTLTLHITHNTYITTTQIVPIIFAYFIYLIYYIIRFERGYIYFIYIFTRPMITTLLIYILLIFTNNLQILPQFLILVKPHHCIKELDRGVVSRITWYYSNGESVGLDSYNRLYLKTYILELFNMIIKLINLTIKWGVFSIIILLISSPLSSNKSKIRNIYKAITALNPKDICKTQIGVIDIETVVINGKLYPYAVGIAYLKDGNKVVKTFYINLSRNGEQSTEYRSNEIFKLVCAFIKSNLTGYTLYAHNIGKFDGYFIIKPFLTY